MSVLARYLGAVSERVPEQKKEREVVLHQQASAICIQCIDVEIDVLTVLLGARHQLKLRSTPELGQ